ncbi:hypothetical protein [Streptomyces albipurpureus]|uniref:Uncharacterized protein n=1 Tax=Streptomyces albipurpureus TaxID=2897419 RepID=A0ABT0USW1_9ACTN|nr:hypothetical protein [Streptomyces sp. CWNU-1]MCM2391160.1 hypothetical protein [Streptomyces sp. CWNU-1]
MESGPAIFASGAFMLFGAGLLLWTVVRMTHRAPVAHGVHPSVAAALTTMFSLASLALGLWCLSRI